MHYLEFDTEKGKYLYDNSTGYVVPSDDIVSLIVGNYSADERDMYSFVRNTFSDLYYSDFKAKYDYVTQCVRHGMFFESPITDTQPPSDEDEIRELCYSVNTLSMVLVITENCNMRCEYCVYNTHYPKEMTYSNESMTVGTAKKSIDLLTQLYTERKKRGFIGAPNLGFYGGEPLLCEQLIKSTVEYARSRMPDISFSITTNGTIMHDSTLRLLTDNPFNVTFSLDGGKENHDRNRRTIDDMQTHDCVTKNIRRLQKYKKLSNGNSAISFSCCYDNYTDLHELVRFFMRNYSQYHPFRIQLSPIIPYDTTFYDYNSEKYADTLIKQNHQKAIGELYEIFVNRRYGNRGVDILQRMFVSDYTFLTRIREHRQGFLNNSCVPTAKMAVYPDGTISICEKMNKNHPIGHVDGGVDWKEIGITMSSYSGLLKACRDCPISRMCALCFHRVNHDKASTFSLKDRYCADELAYRRDLLMRIYTSLENGVDILAAFQGGTYVL